MTFPEGSACVCTSSGPKPRRSSGGTSVGGTDERSVAVGGAGDDVPV